MAREKTKNRTEALILCIDRDDDLGKKAGVEGPVIGEKANLEAAKALALEDPEDTDVNAIFAAVKEYHRAGELYRSSAEIVTLTGHKDVGIKSDHEVLKQLRQVLKRFNPKGVVLVTDGAEDDELLPIIQSESKVLSKKTVTVKQSKELESAYFKILDFFGKIGDNPRMAKQTFGIPGALLLLIVMAGFFRLPVVEMIFVLLGTFLLVKGFGYEERLYAGLNDLKSSIVEGKISRIAYLFALLIFTVGLLQGYQRVDSHLVDYRFGNPQTPFEAFALDPLLTFDWFLLGAIDFTIMAIVIVAVGSMLHNFIEKQYLKIHRQILVVTAALLVLYLVSNNLYWYLLYINPDSPIKVEGGNVPTDFTISIIVSLAIFAVVQQLLKIVFFEYLARKKKLEESLLGKDVVDKDGREFGRVTRVAMKGSELQGVYVRKRLFPAKEIKSRKEKVVVDV